MSWTISEGIAVLSIGRDGMHSLSPAIRADLSAALERAGADDAVTGIVLRAEEHSLAGPLDADEALHPADPDLSTLCRKVEDCPKPVVALIEGTVTGPGAELVLAAHARVAAPGARIGFLQIAQGLPPAAGASQRLPRLVGAEAALTLLLSGQARPLDEPGLAALTDRATTDEGPLAEARAMARDLAAAGTLRRTRDRRDGFADPVAFQEAVSAQRNGRARGAPLAYGEIVGCVEAAQLLPFAAGLDYERAAFETCYATEVSRALRHLHAAERAVLRRAVTLPGEVQPVSCLGLAGGGIIGTGVTLSALDAGLKVIVLERDAEALRALSRRVSGVYDRAVARGRLSDAQRKARLDRLRGIVDPKGLEDAEVVIDALRAPGEDLSDLRRTIAGPVTDERIFASTVNGTALWPLADDTEKPRRTVGLNFQVPPHASRLVEIGRREATRDMALATAAALVRRLGKLPILTRPAHGYPSDRLRAALLAGADLALAAGARPVDVDSALRGWGLSRGIYEALDMAGLDTAAEDGRDGGLRAGLIAAGHRGRGTGRGYYLYDAGDGPVPNPEAERLLGTLRSGGGAPDAATICNWCHAALANEGTRMIADGTVSAAGDIDLVAVHALGLSRARGGPMVAADMKGLLEMRKTLLSLAERDAALWAPDALWQDLIKNGRRFSDGAGD